MNRTVFQGYSGRQAGKTTRLKEMLDQSPGGVVVVRSEAVRTQMVQSGIKREQIKLFAELKGSAKNVHFQIKEP